MFCYVVSSSHINQADLGTILTLLNNMAVMERSTTSDELKAFIDSKSCRGKRWYLLFLCVAVLSHNDLKKADMLLLKF